MTYESAREDQWSELKNKLMSRWNNLSSEEIEQTHGNFTTLRELLQNKCGLRPPEAARKLFALINDEGVIMNSSLEKNIPQTAPQSRPHQSAIDRNAHYELDGVSFTDDQVIVSSDGHDDNGPQIDKNPQQLKINCPISGK